MVGFESSLELDFIYCLDVHPAVISFEWQPLEIKFSDSSGRARHYTPDFLIHYSAAANSPERRVLCEVKFLADLDKDWNALKPGLAAAGSYADERSWRFTVYSEHEIRTHYLWNARFLWTYCRSPVLQEPRARVLKLLKTSGPTTIADFCAKFRRSTSSESDCIVAFWQLIAEQRIRTDLSARLDARSRIWK